MKRRKRTIANAYAEQMLLISKKQLVPSNANLEMLFIWKQFASWSA